MKRDTAEAEVEAAKPMLDAEEIALREAEAKQQAELAARQTEDAEKKQRRKKDAETVATEEIREAKPAEAAVPPVRRGHAAQTGRQASRKGGKGRKEGEETAGEGSRLEGRVGQAAQHQDAWRRLRRTGLACAQGALRPRDARGRNRDAARVCGAHRADRSRRVGARNHYRGRAAHKMSVKAAEVIKVLMKLGTMVTINQVLDQTRR